MCNHLPAFNNNDYMIFLPVISVFCYLLATVLLFLKTFRSERAPAQARQIAIVSGLIAVFMHAAYLYQRTFVGEGLDLSFFNTFSLLGWLVAGFVLFSSLYRPLENLLVILFPFAALALTLSALFPEQRILSSELTTGLRIHILLSITAYSLLMVSALQAILLATQERLIATKRISRVINILPPLQVMEQLLVQIIVVGFFLLSLSLASGMMFINDMFAQHLVHKTVLSIVAWLIYGILLCGRLFAGWRGKRITRWALGGFFTLLLAYIGTRIVLEFILQRV